MKKVLFLLLGLVFFTAQVNSQCCQGDKGSGASCSEKGGCPPDVKCQDYSAPEVKIGEKTCCPVSKKVIVVDKKTPTAKIKGKTYYVCDKDCAKKLTEKPDAYLTRKEAAAKTPQSETK